MADFLRDNPELQPFLLSNVRFTGVRISAGGYGGVEEVTVPGAICAAKKIDEMFLDRSEIRKSAAQFVRECQLMSTHRHPNIVQFLGVCFFSRLATANPRHGATTDEPSRLAGPRNEPSFPARRAQTLLPAEPKVLDSARRGEWPNLPPRAIAAHHPPRLVGHKRSPELWDGGQDSRPGRGSICASCSHHDKGTWGHSLHASRGHGEHTWR